jgi:hypothetical protein
MPRTLALIVAVVALAGRTAHASRYRECWELTQDHVEPAPGAIGVPRNAHVWVAGGWVGPYTVRTGGAERQVAGRALNGHFGYVEIDPGPLDADTSYTIAFDDREITHFQTGRGEVATPPGAPRTVELVATARDGQWGTTQFGPGYLIDLTAAGEAAVLEVEALDSMGHGETFYMPAVPQSHVIAPRRCGLDQGPGDELCVNVRAVDIAGRRSPATRACARLVGDIEYYGQFPRVHIDPPDRTPLAILAGALAGLGAIALLAAILAGRARQTHAHTADSDGLVLDIAARKQAVAAATAVASLATLAAAALTLPPSAGAAALAGVVGAIVRWQRIRRFARGVGLVRAGGYAFTTTGYLRVGERDFARARARRFPAARTTSA